MNILTYQNIALFTISSLSLISCIYYKLTDSSVPFIIMPPIIGAFSIVDLYYNNRLEYKIHHALSLGVILYNYAFNVDDHILTYALLKTETSSLFLIFKYYLDKRSFLYIINAYVFLYLFTKFRIVDLYNVICPGSELYAIIDTYSPNSALGSGLILVSCYGLYILNLYWFFIMNKTIYKEYLQCFNTDALCQYLCTYLLFLNIPICVYVYSLNPCEKHWIDVAGVSLLALSSYRYHHYVYKIKRDEPNAFPYMLLFNDNCCVHLRSFLTIVVSYSHLGFILLSFTAHLVFIYITIYYLIQYVVKPSPEFFSILNKLTICPIVIDIALGFVNTDIELGIPYLLVNILIALLLIINPFDKLNHAALHVLLLVQTYYICLMLA